jgi:PTS system ascorbate-specific IIA component
MVRLLIIAHAPLASALKAVAAHIDPEASASIGVCDVQPDASVDDVVGTAAGLLDAQETLILTDVFGATPCNAAQRLGERASTRVVAGVNVPVLWRALGHLKDPLDTVAELAVAGGQQGVLHVTVTRPQHQVLTSVSHDSKHDHHQQ